MAAVCSSLGGGRRDAMGLGEPWVSHQAAAAGTDSMRRPFQCADPFNAPTLGGRGGGRYRRAVTSSRDKPQPTQTGPRSMKWLARKEPVETVAVPAPKYARTISFGRSARMTR